MAAVLTACSLWPLWTVQLLGSDHQLLLRDMVVVPEPAITDAVWGLGSSAARAVPQDIFLAYGAQLIEATVLAKVLLTLALLVGGIGAAALAHRLVGVGWLGQISATALTLWNPYVVERLLQGQWSLVIAAVLFPAIAYAWLPDQNRPGQNQPYPRDSELSGTSVGRVRSSRAARLWSAQKIWSARLCLMACAALTPTGAILATIVAVIAASGHIQLRQRSHKQPNRQSLLAGLTGIVVSLPWLAATALSESAYSGALSDPTAAASFAARAERFASTWGAVIGLGGIWNSQTVPPSREEGVAALTILLLLPLLVLGARRVWPGAARFIVLALVSVVSIALLASPWGIALMQWLLAEIPGAGLLRDTQKWVALALPGYVVLLATGVEQLRDYFAGSLANNKALATALSGAIAAVAVFGAVPDLPKAMAPLRPVEAWADWQHVTDKITDSSDTVAVLPAGSYRVIAERPVLDPAWKIIPAEVLATGDLIVKQGDTATVVAGEGSSDAETTLLAASEPEQRRETLQSLGVNWVLVENSPGAFGDFASLQTLLQPAYVGENLQLYRVPAASESATPRPETTAASNTPSPTVHFLMWTSFLLWLACFLGGAAVWLVLSVFGRRPRR